MNDPIEVQIEALDAQIAELTERRKDLLLRVQIECRRCRSEYAISRISWNFGGERRDWFVSSECGHALIRRGTRAPRRVRCEGCPLVAVSSDP